MPRPMLDIATELGSVLTGFTFDVNVFPFAVRPFQKNGVGAVLIPDKAIFVVTGTSPEPTRMFRAGDIRVANVQIFFRDKGPLEPIEAQARIIWLAARDMDVSPGSTLQDYISVFTSNSEPIFVGKDNQEHEQFSINVEATYREP